MIYIKFAAIVCVALKATRRIIAELIFTSNLPSRLLRNDCQKGKCSIIN